MTVLEFFTPKGLYYGAAVFVIARSIAKKQSYLSPEEKLLRAIFGEKAEDTKDTSF